MLKPGLYEQILTERIQRLLDMLPPSLKHSVGDLDAGEAHERLARHLYTVLREALHGMSGEEKRNLKRS